MNLTFSGITFIDACASVLDMYDAQKADKTKKFNIFKKKQVSESKLEFS